MEIIDFSKCSYSDRHGRYGGNAGNKDGIIYNNENWIIKYPKTTKGMHGQYLAPYTTSPLSEYIGSHIYELLGYDVHETLLGIRQGKLVVACKDFQKHYGDLGEIRTLKNGAHEQIQKLRDEEIPISATGDDVNLDELMFHLKNNPLLQIDKLKERFYDQMIIDIFIDNNDRNNGNWGILYENNERKLAPVFDNGNSFSNKISEEGIVDFMKLPEKERRNRFIGERTAYSINNHLLSAKKLLSQDDSAIKDAIIRVYPKINKKIDEINQMIDDIPACFNGYEICSDLRKEFYKEGLQARMELLLEPVYKKVLEFVKEHESTTNILHKSLHDSKFISLCGLPGSGKTNIISKLNIPEPYTVVSLSDMRKECYSYLGRHDLQFAIDHTKQIICSEIEKGNTVVYDASNLHKKDREYWLATVKEAGVSKCELIIMESSLNTRLMNCIDRGIPISKDRMTELEHNFLEEYPTQSEGWDEISVIEMSERELTEEYVNIIEDSNIVSNIEEIDITDSIDELC